MHCRHTWRELLAQLGLAGGPGVIFEVEVLFLLHSLQKE
jgi:hypothetical protein